MISLVHPAKEHNKKQKVRVRLLLENVKKSKNIVRNKNDLKLQKKEEQIKMLCNKLL